jgi:hypothetical protein
MRWCTPSSRMLASVIGGPGGYFGLEGMNGWVPLLSRNQPRSGPRIRVGHCDRGQPIDQLPRPHQGACNGDRDHRVPDWFHMPLGQLSACRGWTARLCAGFAVCASLAKGHVHNQLAFWRMARDVPLPVVSSASTTLPGGSLRVLPSLARFKFDVAS